MSERSLKGVILAGGEGTRFRPLTYYFQKCMIPVGAEQRPVLEYTIRLFSHHGIRDVILLVGYKYRQIENYFGDGGRFGVSLSYVLDKPELKGSANALVNAYRLGAVSEEDCLIAYYGDIISNIDLRDLASQHLSSKSAATVALARGYRIRVGTADVRDGMITRFREKPELDSSVSVGVLALSGSMLEEVDRMSEAGRPFDLMGDVIPRLIERGRPVGAYISDAFWYDLGSLERYESFENDGLSRELGFLLEGDVRRRPQHKSFLNEPRR
ncbi:hypothetical protein AC482_00525 [miscellaneous Crenarchaeota group-15 archaeon DG-45]|uniref:Nucleotidyl transferase domain-containing protein n=1 Tax=miscellaneous Crenarchaeota group-15 archaeon DG-45 TaxID=1685127 RepID=A0A0M0BSF4_9ARCH|nr:MAG: hypothetical protein AC482_00525 [miscellaneous Crenarchaeota group-15 archaeon DG-45]